MSKQAKQWGAIIVMIFLFAMIAFVTNLCTPMATIIKNDLSVSPILAQVGNYGNFIAYLLLGIPSGLLIQKMGYKKTALLALFVGILGIGIQWISGQMGTDSPGLVFTVYLIGAFIAGCCMCMLNTVVNPMLNLLGGGGNGGNQLIQIGGVFNSSAAVAVYILMGAMIGDASKAHIANATPALLIAMGIFALGFVVILFTKIQEPEQVKTTEVMTNVKGALSFRHFKLGILGIGLYMGIEVGVPNFIQQYLSEPTTADVPGLGMDGNDVGTIVALYWLMMLIGRFVGGAIGNKFSSRAMITTVSTTAIILIGFGMYALSQPDWMISIPGIDWANLATKSIAVPLGVLPLLLVGLCTSVMWGGIFNMAVEGLGKYTAIASGIFMTMVFFCAVMQFIQAGVATFMGYLGCFIVPLLCAVYVLFYARIGSRVQKVTE